MAAPPLHAVLSAAALELTRAGLSAEEAAVDVDVLARHVLGWDRAALLARRRDPAPPALATALAPLIARRAGRTPVAYLTGQREFWGLDLDVTPDVLVPRPETELLVEEALARLPAVPPFGAPRVVDVGTGSGCVAVALAATDADVRIVAIDRSRAALRVADGNLRRYRLRARVALLAGDLLSPLSALRPCADMIVSNPPYVPVDSPDVSPDVRLHEPALALYAGADGLAVITRLVSEAAALVPEGGWLLFEFGAGQGDRVEALATSQGLWHIDAVRADLQGHARVACLRRTTRPAPAAGSGRGR